MSLVNKTNKIEFWIEEHLYDVIEHPTPALKNIPEWYKKAPRYFSADQNVGYGLRDQGFGSEPKGTYKSCMPFLDALQMGYTITLWQDLVYEKKFGKIHFSWHMAFNEGRPPFVEHSMAQSQGVPIIDDGVIKNFVKFESPWKVVTPPGYSILMVPCLNHFEKRFFIASGVVESDDYLGGLGVPCVWLDTDLEEGEVRVLPKGTPLAQIIPFRREDYKMEVVKMDKKKEYKKWLWQNKLAAYVTSSYKKLFWKKKTYR